MVPIFIVYALLSKLTFKPVFLPYYDHCMVRLGYEKCYSYIVVIDLVMFAQNVLFFIPEHLLGVWGIFLNILYLSECLNIPLKNFLRHVIQSKMRLLESVSSQLGLDNDFQK